MHSDTDSEGTRELTRSLAKTLNTDAVGNVLRNAAVKEHTDNVCLSVVPIRLFAGDRSVVTYAFLDPGSTTCFITKQLYDELRPSRSLVSNTQMDLKTLSGADSMESLVVKGLVATDINCRHSLTLPEVYTLSELPADRSDTPSPKELAKWPHLRNIDIPRIEGCDVGILIGQHAPDAIKPCEVVDGGSEDVPFAVRTRLGWIIQGLRCPTQ